MTRYISQLQRLIAEAQNAFLTLRRPNLLAYTIRYRWTRVLPVDGKTYRSYFYTVEIVIFCIEVLGVTLQCIAV